MEQAKKSRKANRTHDELRDVYSQKIAFHEIQANQLRKKLADLDNPKQPRKSRMGITKALAEVKAEGVTPEEIMLFLKARKEATN
jgi:hypothetical protein